MSQCFSVWLPMSVLMTVYSLLGKVQRYHGINFWTEDRFDYICLWVYQPQIKHRVEECRQWSEKVISLKTKNTFLAIFVVYLPQLPAYLNRVSIQRCSSLHVWLSIQVFVLISQSARRAKENKKNTVTTMQWCETKKQKPNWPKTVILLTFV